MPYVENIVYFPQTIFISNYFLGAPSQLLSVPAPICRVFRSTLPTKIGLKWSDGQGETFGKSRFYEGILFLDFDEKNRQNLSTVAYKAVAYK